MTIRFQSNTHCETRPRRTDVFRLLLLETAVPREEVNVVR